jgi:hypothetical protein
MILYFDNYITDQPFYAGGHETLGEVRDSKAKIYHMPSKLDITKYTLLSYAEIPFSKIIIKYELENPSQKKDFEDFLKKTFPKSKLVIIYGRSDSQKKFQESLKIMNEIKDDWIFYAGNNDHPFVAPDIKTLNACLNKAKEIAKKSKNKFISISVSHFSEFVNKSMPGSPHHEIRYKKVKILEQTKDFLVSFFPKGINHSMIIAHKNLFNYWFFSGDSKGDLVRRSEDMEAFVKSKPQILITPKRELCAHFDAEVPKMKSSHGISYDLCPPLFIPPGFFKKQIKIRYGYNDYKENWININPSKKKYSFRDEKNGTDLKLSLEQLPLFWKKRIKIIDKNKNLNNQEIKNSLKRRRHLLLNPFPKKSKFFYFKYRTKKKFFIFLHKFSFVRKPIKNLMKKSNKFNEMYEKSVHIKFKG